MPNTLNLSIATYNLDISVFSAQGGYDRRLIDTGETEYSIYGTPLDSGTFYDPKHIWTISCFLTKEEYQALQAIFSYHDKHRRSQQDYRITLRDRIEQYTESASTPSRGVVPGGVVTTVGSSISYPASFYVRMFSPAAVIQAGLRSRLATFTLKELDRFI
jgi:hypothetical protein